VLDSIIGRYVWDVTVTSFLCWLPSNSLNLLVILPQTMTIFLI